MARILISGGGTGGHVFPAIAVADAIRKLRPDADILFVGASGKLEMTEVPKAGYRVIGLDVRGFKRKFSLEQFKVLFKLAKSLLKARTIIKNFKPDVVLGVGGYASGPVMKIAQWLDIPLVIQEQNSYPGVTNRLMAGSARIVCTAFEEVAAFFPKSKFVLTGNPVRKCFFQAVDRQEAYRHFGLNPGLKTIGVFGGSLGARTLNEAIISAYGSIQVREDIQVLWQAGRQYEAEISSLPIANHPRIKMVSFIDRMEYAYAVTDVAVTRAGALTIAELCATGTPAILIPSPNVAEDHQTRNARSLISKGAAWMLEDYRAVAELWEKLDQLLADEKLRLDLSSKIKALAKPDAAERIAQELLYLAESK
jgi:UDP-N-acetylglucosamine--N-acetylmuramyl-(pentapeptide) pyrophosphoryl-undecaprenol N-acetylglucosamine transferase